MVLGGVTTILRFLRGRGVGVELGLIDRKGLVVNLCLDFDRETSEFQK